MTYIDEHQEVLERDLKDAEDVLRSDEEALVAAQRWVISSKQRRDEIARQLEAYKVMSR